MDIFDLPKKDFIQKDEIEILDKQKHEFKFIGRMKVVAGLTVFSFNYKTGEIKKAPLEKTSDVGFFSQKKLHNERIVVEPNCIYRQALNMKNFKKVLRREGLIK